jgi:diguanylate cyclase (GGDEF)-like protein
MVDVVSFKEINDRWSPAEGDRCLREVAEALGSSLRDPDQVFRWGGDEFVLILTGTVVDATDPLRDRLDVIIGSSCSRPDRQPLELRFAAAQLQDEQDPEELVEMVGLAMTATKMEQIRA